MTLIAPPADAPKDAAISGKFTGPVRNEVAGSVPGDTGAMHGKRPTGLSLPFEGQPLQGLSGYAMNRAADGTVWTLTDNGFGSKANSPDALLMFHRIAPDFETGGVTVAETVFLRDPGHKVPFRIACEGTEGRYLTGADFDPESIQILGERVFIGEEFGPYVIEATLQGHVVAVHPVMVKRIVLIDTASVDAGGFVRRIGHVDLMAIADPDGRARIATAGGTEGRFSLPFFTIEDVMVADATHILVGVDNNLPYSTGRALDRAMDNEVVLLSVPELLAAK